jgi:hypothetical protein
VPGEQQEDAGRFDAAPSKAPAVEEVEEVLDELSSLHCPTTELEADPLQPNLLLHAKVYALAEK